MIKLHDSVSLNIITEELFSYVKSHRNTQDRLFCSFEKFSSIHQLCLYHNPTGISLWNISKTLSSVKVNPITEIMNGIVHCNWSIYPKLNSILLSVGSIFEIFKNSADQESIKYKTFRLLHSIQRQLLLKQAFQIHSQFFLFHFQFWLTHCIPSSVLVISRQRQILENL